jgi:hypothetical protein
LDEGRGVFAALGGTLLLSLRRLPPLPLP